MKRAVRSRRKVYGQLLKHARRQPHRECCGILAGQDGLITQAFPAKNAATDPVRNYEITPKEIVRLMGELRKRRLEFLGFYHSHPDHPAQWSPTDFAEAHWIGCSYVITSVERGKATSTNSFLLAGSIEESKRFENEGISVAQPSPA